MKKARTLLVCLVAAGAAFGQNLYRDRTYLSVVAPQRIGVCMQGATTTAVVVSIPAVTNSTVTGADMRTYPGTSVLLLGINCGDSGNGVITPSVTSCASTNGTYSNETQFTSIAYTNANTMAAFPFVPNQTRGFLRVTFAATAVTNGSVSATLANLTR